MLRLSTYSYLWFPVWGILWPIILQNIFWKQRKVVAKLLFCQVRIFLNLSVSIIIMALNTYVHTRVTSSMKPGTPLAFAFIQGWCGHPYRVPSLQPCVVIEVCWEDHCLERGRIYSANKTMPS